MNIRILLLALVLLAGVGLISLLPPLRLDLTESRLYTLSDGTQHLLKKLEGNPVHLTLYYSDKVTENIPALRTYSRRVKEILHEYELQANGKIKLDIIDPEPFSEQEDQAAAFGLQGVPAGNNDKLYFGLAGETKNDQRGANNNKREIIAFFNPEKERSLEYDISQLIYRLQEPKPVVVGIISDLPIFQHRNMSSPQTIKPKVILEQLRQMFDIKRVYDNNIDKIDDEVDVLMVVQPHLWPENTLYAIDQFVLRGGRLLVFMDPNAEMDESEKDLFDAPAFQDKSSSLEQLLTAWGVQYDPKKIVLDYTFAHTIPVTRYGQALPHVGVLGIRDQGFNREEAITSGVDQVNMSTAGALAPLPGSTTRFSPLMQSSKQSQLMDVEEYKKYPNHSDLLSHFHADGKGPYTLGALISGHVKTAFPDGRPIIADKKTTGKTTTDKTTSAQPPESTHLSASTQDISVVLFADTDMLDDRMWVEVQDFYGQPVATPWASNSDLIVNALEKLSGSVDLINVRSRGSYNRPFLRVNELERKASEKFREQQESLQVKLAETEKEIKLLGSEDQAVGGDAKPLYLSNKRKKEEVEKFQMERFQIRKKLREVQHQLNQDIENLGSTLKMINILAVPALLSVFVLVMTIIRRRRFAKIHESRE